MQEENELSSPAFAVDCVIEFGTCRKFKGYVVVFRCLYSKGWSQEKVFFFNKFISVSKQGFAVSFSEEQLSHSHSLLNCLSESLYLSSSLLATRKACPEFRYYLFDIMRNKRMLVLAF